MEKRFLLRFDDICPTMKWSIWNRIEEIMIRYKIKPIIAVIPDNQDPSLICEDEINDYWEKLRKWQKLGWTIALHGFHHKYENQKCGILKINDYSEFAGVSYDEQNIRIKKGLEILKSHGLNVTTWIAPAHSFDYNTIKALKSNGIHIISDGYSNDIFRFRDMLWIPCQLYRFEQRKKGVWTVCKHPNMWTKKELLAFEQEINRWNKEITDLDSILMKYKEKKHRWSYNQIILSFARCTKIYFKRFIKKRLVVRNKLTKILLFILKIL